MKKLGKTGVLVTDCNYWLQYLLAVTSDFNQSPGPPLLGDARGIVMASNYGIFFDCCFVCCYPGGHWGNTT
jgi:hypothetical protein